MQNDPLVTELAFETDKYSIEEKENYTSLQRGLYGLELHSSL